MPEEPLQVPEEPKVDQPRASPPKRLGSKLIAAKWLVAVVILVVAVLLVQLVGSGLSIFPRLGISAPFLDRIPLLGRIFSSGEVSAPEITLNPVFGGNVSGELLSPKAVLGMVGRGPVDPSHVLFPQFEKPILPEQQTDEKGRLPQEGLTEQPESSREAPGTDRGGTPDPSAKPPSSRRSPRLVETPIVVTREPSKVARTGEKSEQQREPGKGELDEKAPGEEGAPSPPGPEKPAKIQESRIKKPDKVGKLDAGDIPDAVTQKRAASEPGAESKREKYQLPGSLRVDVTDYKGTKVKWGLLVILDDSAAMARPAKPWEPSKVEAARNFVGKLSGSLTPGSKIAVRDFYCSESSRKKDRGSGVCLSHMLYSWADLPFKGLAEKLEKVEPAGRTDPCAAVAYAIKTDLSALAGLTPRAVVVTDGIRKCDYRQAIKAVEAKGGASKLKVDVIALGMNKKRLAGYSQLVAKSNGILLKVETPSEVETALSRYGKILKAPAMSKLEVKGEKADFKINNGEEITLAPGSYSIVVPPIPGLDPSHRVIKEVKIASGDNKVLDVRVQKGKLVVRPGKK
jgi:hypothetical protein